MESLSYWNVRFLSCSLALNTSSMRLGSVANNLLLPYLYTTTGSLSLGFWVGFGFSLLCLALALVFVIIERCIQQNDPPAADVPPQPLSGIFRFPAIFWLLSVYVGLFYMGMNSCNAVASAMAQSRFGFDVREAGFLIVS